MVSFVLAVLVGLDAFCFFSLDFLLGFKICWILVALAASVLVPRRCHFPIPNRDNSCSNVTLPGSPLLAVRHMATRPIMFIACF